MKKITSQFFSVLVLCLVLLISTSAFAQVGIGTVNPTETLDVAGNVKFSGALMPGNAFGGVDQILLSQGTGTPPVWGPGFINRPHIDFIGKFYVPPQNIVGRPGGPNTYTQTVITVSDPEMTPTTVVSWNFVGPLPTAGDLQYGNNFRWFVEARLGFVVFHIYNGSNTTLLNAQIQYVAYYNQ